MPIPLIGRVDETARAGNRRLDETQGRGPQRVGSRLDDIHQRDAIGLHPLRIGPNLKLRSR